MVAGRRGPPAHSYSERCSYWERRLERPSSATQFIHQSVSAHLATECARPAVANKECELDEATLTAVAAVNGWTRLTTSTTTTTANRRKRCGHQRWATMTSAAATNRRKRRGHQRWLMITSPPPPPSLPIEGNDVRQSKKHPVYCIGSVLSFGNGAGGENTCGGARFGFVGVQ
jgi:hypothetical protein